MQFNEKLANELESLPSSGTNIEEALSDYIVLRDTVRACASKQEN